MTSLEIYSRLIAGIYETTLAPERWPEVISDIAADVGALLGGIIAGPANRPSVCIAATEMDPASVREYRTYYSRIDPVLRVRGMPPGTVVTQDGILPRDAMARDEFYNDWARPQGIYGCVVARFMPADSTGLLILSPPARGPELQPEAIELMSALLPHLRAAVQIRHLIGTLASQRDGPLDALGSLGHAALFVNAGGRAVYANEAAVALLRSNDGLSCGPIGLRGATPAATSTLRRLIARATSPSDEARCGGSLRLQCPSGRPDLMVTVSPVGRTTAEVIPLLTLEALALVMVAVQQPEASATAEALGALFGLTRTESNVATAIAKGQDVKSVAAALGIAVSTVRTHLHRTFEKTRTRRQAELVHLMDRMAPAGLSDQAKERETVPEASGQAGFKR